MAYRDDLNVLRRLKQEEEAAMMQMAGLPMSVMDPNEAIDTGGYQLSPMDYGQPMQRLPQPQPMNALRDAMRIAPQAEMPEQMPRTTVEDNTRYRSTPGSDMPMNSFRIESGPDAGRARSLNFADINPAWGQGQEPELQPDLSQPIELSGVGKGYYIKGKPGSALINGKEYLLGVDRDRAWKELGRQMELAKAKQGLEKGQVDMLHTEQQTAASRAQMNQREDPTTQDALAKRYGKPPEGMRWKADGSGLEQLPGGKQEQQGTKALELLDMAEPLLKDATESLAGTAWDKFIAIGGGSNKGADATAKLKPIAGQLVSMMPRMEGPQSNYDVKLYQEMAGALADSTVPIEQRKAAIQTLRMLNAKYANGQGAAPTAAPPAESRVVGKVYQTPKGPMKWTGAGWLPS